VWRADNFRRHIRTYHKGGITAAASNGDEETVTWFLKKHPGYANEMEDGQSTPLCLAASKGHEKVVGLLLDNNADTEVECLMPKRVWGVTALWEAMLERHYNVAKLLVCRGADINVKYLGNTILNQVLRYCGDLDLVRLLLDRSADINFLKWFCSSGTALGFNLFAEKRLEAVKILLARGVDCHV